MNLRVEYLQYKMKKFCLFLLLIYATHIKAHRQFINSYLQSKITSYEEQSDDEANVLPSNNSYRFVRQAQQNKDPYSIARRKCVEYSNARYVESTPSNVKQGEKPAVKRELDCPQSKFFLSVANGELAGLKEFPHMAILGYPSLGQRSNDPEFARWLCGGSLISDRYVLSAAHCFSSGDLPAKWVKLGELVIQDEDDEAQPKDFEIERLIPHPRYKSSEVYHDIMLVKLNQIVTFSPHMRPICLYTSPILSEQFTRSGSAVITGWGATLTGEQTSEALLKAQIRITHDEECSRSFRGDSRLPNGYDPQTMICAGDKIEGRDTCEGDSGGPLQITIPEWLCMFWQLGITSYGHFICGQKNESAIYTKVRPYVPWIQSIVWP